MKLFILIALCLFSLVASAQIIDTDRPDQTESSAVLPVGRIQVEAGIGFSTQNQTQAIERTWTVPTQLYRINLLRGVELRLQTQVLSSRTFDEDYLTRFDDIQIGTKIQLLQREESATQIAVMGHLVVPTASRSLFADRDWGSLARVLISHDLDKGWSIGYNLGYQHFHGSDLQGIYTLALAYGWNDKLTLYIEPYGEVGEADTSFHRINAGWTYKTSDRGQLDFSFGTGFNEESNFASFGYSLCVDK